MLVLKVVDFIPSVLQSDLLFPSWFTLKHHHTAAAVAFSPLFFIFSLVVNKQLKQLCCAAPPPAGRSVDLGWHYSSSTIWLLKWEVLFLDNTISYMSNSTHIKPTSNRGVNKSLIIMIILYSMHTRCSGMEVCGHFLKNAASLFCCDLIEQLNYTLETHKHTPLIMSTTVCTRRISVYLSVSLCSTVCTLHSRV